MKDFNIPNCFYCGGQKIEVRLVERCDCNNTGECHACSGYIEIADKFNKDETQSVDSKQNTFMHELVHTILYNMGESELNNNEKFVSSFAGFLTEALRSAEYDV